MKYLSLSILGLLLVTCDSMTKATRGSQHTFEYADHIDSLVDVFLTDTLMNALSLGVYYKGEEFIGHYGELDPGQKNKPSDNTIYDIGSVTKTFVGTLISDAALEGKLSIEDDIRIYLDDEYPNLHYENEAIKIKHLITHTARLPRYLPEYIIGEFEVIDASLPRRMAQIEGNYSKSQFFEDLKHVVIDTLPGYRYAYSNAGGELASYILEGVYEMPFEKILQEHLFKRANMTSTAITLTAPQETLYANGYGDYKNLTPPIKTGLWGGSGHGKSTIGDLMNYMKYHLSYDNLSVQQSHEVLFERDVINGDPRNKMGYMWVVSTDRDFGPYIKHHGGAYGTQNWMLVYPEAQLGISIITNQSGWHTAGKLIDVVYSVLDEIASEQ